MRQIFHRILAYKMYHSRRCYLPVCNSCEWLVVLNSIIEGYYSRDSKHFHPRNKSLSEMGESHFSKESVFGTPKTPNPVTDEEFHKLRKELFRKEKAGRNQ